MSGQETTAKQSLGFSAFIGLNPVTGITFMLFLFAKEKPGVGVSEKDAIAIAVPLSLINHATFGFIPGLITALVTKDVKFAAIIGGAFAGLAFAVQGLSFLVRVAKSEETEVKKRIVDGIFNSMVDVGLLYSTAIYPLPIGLLTVVSTTACCGKVTEKRA